MLRSIEAHALEPHKIKALIHLIREDLGFRLHRAVQKVKSELSHKDEALFEFSDGDVELKTLLERSVFEAWIAEELQLIQTCIDSLFTSSGVPFDSIDAVFLTGGSSFVPAVRRIFEQRFGAEKIRTGHEFTSVAHGLALKAGAVQSLS